MTTQESVQKFTQFVDKCHKLHPGTIPVIRIGDFYEAFGRDAELLARVLGLTITSRHRDSGKDLLAMVGFPYHQLHNYTIQAKSQGVTLSVWHIEDSKLSLLPIGQRLIVVQPHLVDDDGEGNENHAAEGHGATIEFYNRDSSERFLNYGIAHDGGGNGFYDSHEVDRMFYLV